MITELSPKNTPLEQATDTLVLGELTPTLIDFARCTVGVRR